MTQQLPSDPALPAQSAVSAVPGPAVGGEAGERPDDLRAQYAVAVQMAVYDGQLSWQVTGLFVQFAILMVVGAIFPSFVGTTSKPILGVAGGLVALAGLVMAGMFGSMSLRIRTYQDLWVARAEDLESLLAPPGVLSLGSKLSRDGSIQIGQSALRMHWMSSAKTKTVMSWLFGLFVMVFAGLLIFNIVRVVQSLA